MPRNSFVATLLALAVSLAFAGTAPDEGELTPSKPAKAAARSASAETSVILVDELLRAENDAAQASLRKSSLIPSGPAPGSEVVAPRPPQTVNVQVVAIFGSAEAPKARVLVDGVPQIAQPGTVLGGACRVEALRDRCVSIAPAAPAVKGRAGRAAGRCPATACWTGETPGQGMPTLSAVGPSWIPGAPMPQPAPLPPMPR